MPLNEYFGNGQNKKRHCNHNDCGCTPCPPILIGPTGPTGPTGATGPTGSTGPTGPTGPTAAIIYPQPLKTA